MFGAEEEGEKLTDWGTASIPELEIGDDNDDNPRKQLGSQTFVPGGHNGQGGLQHHRSSR